MTRIYFPGSLDANSRRTLPPEQAHHVVNVMRLAAGAAVIVFDGSGTEFAATITHVDRKGVTLAVGEGCAVDRESPLAVTLAQGISSGDRMDYTVQKAVELGVAAIQPVAASRSVVRLDAERSRKRIARWQGIVIAACEQCGRNRLPEVLPIRTTADWLAQPVARSGTRFILLPGGATRLRDLPAPTGPVTLLVGPEGGFDDREQQDAIAAGYAPLSLGPRVLRTETAALAALAAMHSRWGDF